MNDPNVHAATHPCGHPNKTAVNAENPIFGRPVDPIPEVSIQQAAVVQSEKNPRETVQSPLINEAVASPALPSAEDLDAVAAETAVKEATGSKADDWTQTKGAGLTDDTSSAKSGAEYTHSSGGDSSKITPTIPVVVPTQEEADAVVAQAKAENDAYTAEAGA